MRLPLLPVALVVALYLALDVANPLMPGALGFGVQNSVDSRQADRARADDVTDPPSPRPTGAHVDPIDLDVARLRPAPAPPRARAPHAPRRALPAFAPHAAPAPSDDD